MTPEHRVRMSASRREAPAQPLGHRSLLAAALGVTGVGVAAAATDGLQQGSLLLTALALDLSLVALASWWVLDASEVRRKQSEARADKSARDDGGDSEAARRIFDEARSMHFVFLSVPAVIVAMLTAFRLWADFVGVSSPLTPAHATAAGVIALAASCLWLVFAGTFASISAEELPESAALSQAFRDARWGSIAIAVGTIGSQAIGGLDVWIGRGLSVWVMVVAFEQTVRALLAWFLPPEESRSFVTPVTLFTREAILVRGNPLESLFDTLEARFGLSFRSSWGIRFMRRSTVPVLVTLCLLVWAFTSLAVVEVQQFGIEERLGRVVPEPLSPGLHVTLPWPFGRVQRFPVKTISTMLVGFQEDDSTPKRLGPRAILWTQSHAQEFSMVLGTGTEVVAVNAIVLYKIHEDAGRLLDYAYQSQNPVARLETCAYRCLREETQSATLADILTIDRLAFAHRLRDRLRRSAESERLGLDVIDVGIVNLHPPVEAASDYLDVISAGIDSTRARHEATGESQAKLQEAAGEGLHLTAQARIDSAKRIGQATGESAEFVALARAFADAPDPTRSRIWFDAIEQILKDKRLFVLDSSLAAGEGELLLDLRPATAPAFFPTTGEPPRSPTKP